jgi:hypothetical protein
MINVFDFQEDKRQNENVLNSRNLNDLEKLKGGHVVKRHYPNKNPIS